MAFQYTFAQQEIASCLVGTISSEALETNLGWLNAPINQELVEEIQAELAPIRNRIWVQMLPFLLLLPALLPWATTLLLLPPLLLLSLLLCSIRNITEIFLSNQLCRSVFAQFGSLECSIGCGICRWKAGVKRISH